MPDQDSDIAGSLSYQIEMKSGIPVNPEKILVYKTNLPSVNKEATLALAKKFNVTGTIRDDRAGPEDLVYGVEILKISRKSKIF